MKVIYRPGTGIIEALVKWEATSNDLISCNLHLKSEKLSDFKTNYGNRTFDIELPYVIYHAEFPHDIIALVRTSEMALDIALIDHEWRVQSFDDGLSLCVRSRKNKVWKVMRHMTEQNSCKETMEKLILEFLRGLPCAEFEITLKGGTIKEYRYIVSGTLENLSAAFRTE